MPSGDSRSPGTSFFLPHCNSVFSPGISLAAKFERRGGNRRRSGRDFLSSPGGDRLAGGTPSVALGDSLGTKNGHRSRHLAAGVHAQGVGSAGVHRRRGKRLCPPSHDCTLRYSVEHPFSLARYTLVLVGHSFRTFHGLSTPIYEFIGVVDLPRRVRRRSINPRKAESDTRIPLPLTLVGVALMFDVVIALGTAGLRRNPCGTVRHAPDLAAGGVDLRV